MIFAAAAQAIAVRGLNASTALIAKKAGVSNCSLFVYFVSKANLLNHLYIELKMEMASAVLLGLPTDGDAREQMAHVWAGWLWWAALNPDKQRALAHLDVSDEISRESRGVAGSALADVASLLARIRKTGPMRTAPLAPVPALMAAAAETTVDFISTDPAGRDVHSAAGFVVMSRMIA